MAASTRKWRKQQKEYNRRKRQATRRREEQERIAKQEATEAERANKLSTVLGLTAAQGFGKNIVSQVLATSKVSQSNYLTNTLRKKRLNEAKARFFKNYDEQVNGSRLLYAIEKEDPFAVKLVVKEPGMNLELMKSALKSLLDSMIDTVGEEISRKQFYRYHRQLHMERVEEKKRVKLNTMMEIFDILFKAGAKIGLDELKKIWSTGEFVYTFLEKYPQLIQPSRFYQNELLQYLQENLEYTEEEIYSEQHEFHRGENGGYGFVPAHLRDEEHLQDLSITTFQAFLESPEEYNEETGNNQNLD